MKRILYSAQARQDLRDILDVIAKDKPQAAVKFVGSLEKHAEILTRFPEIGTARPDLLPDLRVLSYRGYAIYYRVHDDVTVERVLGPGWNVSPDSF